MKKSLIVSSILFGVSLLTTAALATDYQVQTVSKTTNIRAKANPKGKLVTKVKAGTKLRIIARNNETDVNKLWLKVETDNGKQGWVAAKVTKFVKPAATSTPDSMNQYNADAPASAPAPAEAAPAAPMDTEAPTPPAPTANKPATPAPADEIPDIEILDSTDNK